MHPWFAIAPIAILLVALAASAIGSSGKTTLQAVSEGLTCQCGCGLTVANCNHPNCSFSVPLRTEVSSMIDKGMARDAIIASFENKYGEKVLSAPTAEGFNLLAWTMPFIAVLAGAVTIVIAVGRWRSPHPAIPAPAEAPTDSDSRLRRRLEDDLREQR